MLFLFGKALALILHSFLELDSVLPQQRSVCNSPSKTAFVTLGRHLLLIHHHLADRDRRRRRHLCLSVLAPTRTCRGELRCMKKLPHLS